jgi:electron transport complex protein RnfE
MSKLEQKTQDGQLIWRNNSVLVQLLGVSPVLGVSTQLAYGIGLGIVTFVVLVASCLSTSLFRKTISKRWRLLWFMLILASYTTLAETLMQLFYFPLHLRLGIYVPLICCNVSILIRMETKAYHSNWKTTFADAIKAGVGLFIAITLFSGLREFLVTGKLLANWKLLLPSASNLTNDFIILTDSPIFSFAGNQAGAFFLLGLVLALINFLRSFFKSNEKKQKNEIVPAKRARVTGRLTKG